KMRAPYFSACMRTIAGTVQRDLDNSRERTFWSNWMVIVTSSCKRSNAAPNACLVRVEPVLLTPGTFAYSSPFLLNVIDRAANGERRDSAGPLLNAPSLAPSRAQMR